MAVAASASTWVASTAVIFTPLPHRSSLSPPSAVIFTPLPHRPSLSSAPFQLLKVKDGCSKFVIKATSSDESSIDANELIADLKEKWDGVENKTSVILYGCGAVAALWFTSVIVGAINSIPLIPKILELVGLGYAGWFVYRYLLFKSTRKELATDIEALKTKISGTE